MINALKGKGRSAMKESDEVSGTRWFIFSKNREVFSVLMFICLVKISSEKEKEIKLKSKDLEIIKLVLFQKLQKAWVFLTCL